MSHRNVSADTSAARPFWSVSDDVQACQTLSQAAVRALVVLSPGLTSVAEATLEEDVIRAARLDRLATQRVLDILQDLTGRVQRALVQAEWEAGLEAAIVDAAARLPLDDAETPSGLRKAC